MGGAGLKRGEGFPLPFLYNPFCHNAPTFLSLGALWKLVITLKMWRPVGISPGPKKTVLHPAERANRSRS